MCAQEVKDTVDRNVQTGLECPSRRQVLRTGVALLPYVVPTVLSFTARPGQAGAPMSPSPLNTNSPSTKPPGGFSQNPGGSGSGSGTGGSHGTPHNPGP